MKQHVISVLEPTPCSLPENVDIFDELINLTVNGRSDAPNSGRRRPYIEAARRVCGGCPEVEQCLSVHGRDYALGVVAGSTDAQREAFFEGRAVTA